MRVLVLYDSKTGNTEKMAGAIAEGIREAGNDVDVKKIGQPFSLSVIKFYQGIILGSPAIYADPTRDMKDFLTQLKEFLGPGNKTVGSSKAGIFGSYGYDGAWSLENKLKGYAETLGFEVFPEPCLKVDTEVKTHPEETIADCRAWGKRFSDYIAK